MTLTDTIRAWRERAAILREIAQIPADEMAGYGLSPEAFRELALMPAEQLARMEGMARLNGVGRERLDSDRDRRIRAAQECLRCTAQSLCRSALARGATASQTAFCPNHRTWAALRQPGAIAAE